MPLRAGLLLGTALLALLGATIIYFPLSAGSVLSVLLPAGILLLKAEFFEKLKLGTLIAGRILILLTCLGWFPASLFCTVAVWILQINIAEAVIKDFSQKNYFNAWSGVVLIATLWPIHFEWNGLFILSTKPHALLWILPYTWWNWNFIALNFRRPISLFHLGVLAAPLLFSAVMLNPAYWFAMRSSTLTLAVVVQMAFKDEVLQYFDDAAYYIQTERVRSSALQALFMGLVVICCLLFYFLPAG